ncbi:hypothetical protein GCM10018779_59040 [Streptomyces griseocarneus]|nr:hypothetical protein GCM10018779_59040 [Streptomyces griseocarneus]
MEAERAVEPQSVPQGTVAPDEGKTAVTDAFGMHGVSGTGIERAGSPDGDACSAR